VYFGETAMAESFFKCPECGHPLSNVLFEEKNGKFSIDFFCEWCEDAFCFKITTGLTNEDIASLEVGKAVNKVMVVKRMSEKV